MPIAKRLFVCFILSLVPAAGASTIRTVAFTGSGSVAPGAGGANFSALGTPILNDVGQIAFTASLLGSEVNTKNNAGIWSEGSGLLALVARKGDVAANSNATFSRFINLSFNNAGQTAFRVNLSNPGVNDIVSIWSEGSGSLALVTQEGSIAPSTNAKFSQINSLVFNNSGQTALTGSFSDPGANPNNGISIWSEGSGSLELVARDGNEAPGTNGIFSSFGFEFDVPVLNDSGQIAFWGATTGQKGNSSGLWAQRNGSLTLVALSGDEAPGTNEKFSYLGPILGGVPAIREFPGFNNAGQTAFLGRAGIGLAEKSGVWSEGSGALALVALSGDKAPGTDIAFSNFDAFDNLVLNGAGQTAFTGKLAGNDYGIWSEGSGSLSLVTHEGKAAPGTDAIFSSLRSNTLTLNRAGQTAFWGELTRLGESYSGDHGIWAQNISGELLLIARKGDLLDVDDGLGTDFRTISGVTFWGGTGNEDGHVSSFNDQGQVAFRATFTDGTSGIFVSNLVAIPEPGSLVLLGVGGVGLLLHRRKK